MKTGSIVGDHIEPYMVAMYCLYSRSHERLFVDWFHPSVPASFDLRTERVASHGSGIYRSAAWRRAVRMKVDYIVEATRQQIGNVMVFSDVDVQFFADFGANVECLLGENEIVCQAESPGGTYCTGFFICRSSRRLVRLWKEVAIVLATGDGTEHDQDVFNRLLRSNPSLARCAYLPYKFFGGGTLTGKRWLPGDYLPIPSSIVLHHANFTVGVRNKVAQLRHVRRRIEEGGLLDAKGVERIVREWRQSHLTRT